MNKTTSAFWLTQLMPYRTEMSYLHRVLPKLQVSEQIKCHYFKLLRFVVVYYAVLQLKHLHMYKSRDSTMDLLQKLDVSSITQRNS